ncbi:MAG: DUF2157 domain-containing protein [Bacteroidota bacterium]
MESKILHTDTIISSEQMQAIDEYEKDKPLSVHWELRILLYLGVLLLTSGAGILIYLNIDTIGHQAILVLIAASCIGCFYYGYKHRLPYSNEETKHPSPFFDYIVLLGSLLFGIFISYLQFQYTTFGLHYGIAVLFPTMVFLFCGYTFDHKGSLSLGITGLAAWAGFTITPLDLLKNNSFSNTTIIYTGFLIGLLLAGFSRYSDSRNIKKHFGFSYNNFAVNILSLVTLTALFDQPFKLFSFLALAGICYYYIRYAIAEHSFLFLLLAVVYGYLGLTYCVFSLPMSGETLLLFCFFYVAASCAGIILFFINYKKILRIKK